MAWSVDDVALSVRRYFSLFLTAPWTLRLERREVRDDERPAGVLEIGEPRATGRATQTQLESMQVVPVTLTLYPATEGTVREVSRRARTLAQDVTDVILYGLALGDDEEDPPRPVSGPFRLPLWDYAEADTDGEDRAGPPLEEVTGRLAVDEPVGARAIQDPLDERRWTVVLELTLTWWRPGRIIPGPVVVEVPGTWEADVDGVWTGEA